MPDKPSHTTKPYPLSRQIIVDSTRLGKEKRSIYGLTEFDVTEARRILHQHEEKTGEAISFTAFILHCLGAAVEEHKGVQGYRRGRKEIVLFDEVDISTVIEVELQNARFPMSHVIRSANDRSVREIHEEIRAVQKNKQSSASMDYWKGLKYFLMLPWFLRRLFYRWVQSDPFRRKRITGTVSLTAVGMYASGTGGWGIGLSTYTTGITLGGISQKPGVVNGEIQPREMLHVTLEIDHDVIDGAPAAQFAQYFKELVESCFGLEEFK
jgi:pyruvate/2-oxoglutarate dehydrogenase complex dihydrolipoamide acyltransferase (E2) component